MGIAQAGTVGERETSMAASYEREGIRFQYPENWRVETSESAEGWSVAVHSPQTAFMLLTVSRDRPPVEETLETTLSALREDYPDLESEESTERIAQHRAQGRDVQFFSMDLTNSCWLRSFRTSATTILILSQTSDLELELMEPVLRAIRASLEVADSVDATGGRTT